MVQTGRPRALSRQPAHLELAWASHAGEPLPGGFVRAVKAALRDLQRLDQLARNPLARCAISSGSASRSNQLHELELTLTALVFELARSSRTEAQHRALRFTYLEPAPTQLLAAERAQLSFGSYRRHLTAGVNEVSRRLWLRLLGSRDTSAPMDPAVVAQ